MRRTIGRPALFGAGLAVVLASCGGDAAPTTTTLVPADTADTADTAVTTSSTLAVVPESTTSTSTDTTMAPSGLPLVSEGDRNETVEAFQFLLNCNGFGDLSVDGIFGPATLAAVEAAQTGLGRVVDGAPDDETMAELSRSCAENRRLEGDGVVTIIGNAAPDDLEAFRVAVLSGSTMAVTVTQGSGLTVTVRGADGSEITSLGQSMWEIDATQDYLIEVSSPSGPVTFALAVNVTTSVPGIGDWILATDGVIYRGTKLSLGDDAQTVIDQIIDFLGHGVRDAYEEFDTDWYSITDPQNVGLRGIFIEGFAFLFFGPDPVNVDRPETFERHRFVGPSDGPDGARPDDYATTAEGITVGDTVADLKAAYGDEVTAGSNSAEHYYRLADSGGELCFYFDTPDEPTDFSPISEIASECRTG